MTIILCDDEPIFLDSLKQKIEKWATKKGHLGSIIIHTFTSSEDLLDGWEHGMQFDAVFLDIEIPNELSGLAVAKEIYNSDPMVPIVFVTSYGQYAEEGYKVNALRYLRKPINEQAVNECMDILWRQWTVAQTECVTFDTPTKLLRLASKSILYIEAAGHYCIITTTDNTASEYKIKQAFKLVINQLPNEIFIQCQRSYAVNIMYIRHVANGVLTMSDGKRIQMGRGFQAELVKRLRQFYTEGCAD